MYPVKLSAKIGNWRLFAKRKSDKGFLSFCQKVFARDVYTCQFCGFQAKEFQEVVNLDQNYQNNKLSNMVTACCFCTQCFFLESVGTDEYGGGTLIYLPEISQNDLNALCHVLFCAMSNATAYQSSAQSAYRGLKYRAQAIEEKFGSGCSKPSVFGQMLIESSLTNANEEDYLLQNVRLLPSHSKFRMQIETWAASALAEIPEN